MKNFKRNILYAFIVINTIGLLLLVPVSRAAIDTAASSATEERSYTIQAHTQHQFQIATQTKINISTTTNRMIQGQINYESSIENKEFAVEINNASEDITLNMTCREEQSELGLLNGNRVNARNRNRFTFQEQFVVNLSCNSSDIQAKLKIKANEKNNGGTWAYYNESTQEWVREATQLKDGFLVTETEHFSTWTIIIPETENNLNFYIIIGIIIGVVALIGVIGIAVYGYKMH